jgi:translation initiation factor 1 (eIF-1/SUI1)
MSKKGKKVQVSGENDLKVDLWGNLSQGDVSSENSLLKSSFEKPSKRYRIKGRLLKSGKGLKPVTEIYEWPTHMSKSDLNAILLKMKQSFGCGGTIKASNKSIELQGDKFNQSESYLKELGFILIRSGG